MPKGYWVVAHRRAPDADRAAAYREIAKGVLEAAGARVLVMNDDTTAKESGLAERAVVIEFPSYEAALAAYESAEYRRALAALAGGAERDFRIVEGVA